MNLFVVVKVQREEVGPRPGWMAYVWARWRQETAQTWVYDSHNEALARRRAEQRKGYDVKLFGCALNKRGENAN